VSTEAGQLQLQYDVERVSVRRVPPLGAISAQVTARTLAAGRMVVGDWLVRRVTSRPAARIVEGAVSIEKTVVRPINIDRRETVRADECESLTVRRPRFRVAVCARAPTA